MFADPVHVAPTQARQVIMRVYTLVIDCRADGGLTSRSFIMLASKFRWRSRRFRLRILS
jgi:hypothetical protein